MFAVLCGCFLKFVIVFFSLGFCGYTKANEVGLRSRTLYENRNWLFGDGQDKKIHPIGTASYGFRVTLPTSIPSSFESSNGHIRHTIEG